MELTGLLWSHANNRVVVQSYRWQGCFQTVIQMARVLYRQSCRWQDCYAEIHADDSTVMQSCRWQDWYADSHTDCSAVMQTVIQMTGLFADSHTDDRTVVLAIIRIRIRIWLLARRNLLWDILRLPSSRRAALGLYVILTLWRGRGANQPPYALLHRSSPRYALCHGRWHSRKVVVTQMTRL